MYLVLWVKNYPDIGNAPELKMTSLKISITPQERIRLTTLKEATELSFAEIFRRTFDSYIEIMEAKLPAV